jgi:hypothetical protein
MQTKDGLPDGKHTHAARRGFDRAARVIQKPAAFIRRALQSIIAYGA